MARKLLILIDDELDNKMSKYSDVDWSDAVQKSLRECIHRKEIADMYTCPVKRLVTKRNKK